MLSALLYLRLTSFQNWVLVRVRRLRQPKYLVGAIFGCAYFYFFFFRGFGRTATHGARRAATTQAMQALDLPQPAMPVDWLPAITALGALALLVFITLMWVVPTQRAALGFTEAEIAFLFPAPITRRALVHFRLLSAQFRSLLGAVVMMLFSNRWTVIGGNALTHAIGWWFIFSAMNLHFSGATFTLTRLTDAGLGTWRRRIWILVAVASAVGLTLARMPGGARWPSPTSELDFQPMADWALRLTSTAPLGWLLWPFKVVLGPFLAADAMHFLAALPPALAIITLHYLWVVHSAVAFEDASVDHAEKRGARLAAWRAGGRRLGAGAVKARPGPFPLAGTGRPEIAFLWKNLLSTWQYFNLRVLLICAAVIVGACIWINAQPTSRGLLPAVGVIALFFAAYTLVVGPQFARQDIRNDLVNADILKTYPLPGWQLILGELLTPVVILTSLLWLSLLTISLSFHAPAASVAWLTPQLRVTGTLALALIAPALVTLQLLVPNAAALLFPGWFQTSRTRGGGPEIIGQRMIFFFAQVLTMAFALLPAAGVATLLIFILQGLIGPAMAVGIAALFVLVVLIGEVWCGLWLLGERFEQLDLSAEIRA